jgi:L-rhamnose-H+ transport protein
MISGIAFTLIAGICQGLFFLPLTLTRQWKWEHNWAVFCLIGMIVLNWILAIIFIPEIGNILSRASFSEIARLVVIGCCWGGGAILFGLGMDKLGMALGYPILMGLSASMGALVPFLIFYSDKLFTSKGYIFIVGIVLTVAGIILCSRAGVAKSAHSDRKQFERKQLTQGLIIAIAGGMLSALPNIGLTFSTGLVDLAKSQGVSPMLADNVVWALLLSFGGIVNMIYCLGLMKKNENIHLLRNPSAIRNIGLLFIMSLLWISSFYLYGISAYRLEKWGAVVGWPLFISISIIVGNLSGLVGKEWEEAPPKSFVYLFSGISTLVLSIIIIAISNA